MQEVLATNDIAVPSCIAGMLARIISDIELRESAHRKANALLEDTFSGWSFPRLWVLNGALNLSKFAIDSRVLPVAGARFANLPDRLYNAKTFLRRMCSGVTGEHD